MTPYVAVAAALIATILCIASYISMRRTYDVSRLDALPDDWGPK